MKALGREHMTLDQLEERHDGEGPVADLVGQRRQRQVDPLGLKAHTLAVERDMHAELVEQDRRQQLRTDEAARRGIERCWRLADLLAIAAGELFPHRLDQLEPARDLLQRLGHILAQLRQARSAAAGTARRGLDHDALAFDVVRPRLAHPACACRRARPGFRRRRLGGKLVLARRGDEFFELQFQLLDQPGRALRALSVQFALELLDPLARSDGRSSGFDIMKPLNQITQQIKPKATIRPASDAGFLEGCANRFRTTGSSAAPARSLAIHRQPMAR
ncbi:hypothetical protein GGD65_008186 [Bradyrhizobium sp. CIR18]|nr:hypothetical protein [Bradyrhizobium sp. CIR18]